jgi:hypothetical protein
MYASLDSIDTILAASDGRQLALQTDHRDAYEIEAERALSTAFVLVRCLNPPRAEERFQVFYDCANEPPEFLRTAIRASGARLLVKHQQSDPSTVTSVQADVVTALMNEAMGDIAKEASRESGDPLSALVAREGTLERLGFPSEEDEVKFWTETVVLGALAAEALRIPNSGTWRYESGGTATLPFVCSATYKGQVATVNPLGKALKFLQQRGGGEEPSALVQAILVNP